MTSIRYRGITAEEYDAFFASEARAYSRRPRQREAERYRPLFELERTHAAFDGEDIVGGTGSFSMEMTVPGATVGAAVISWVSVQPTHRRRGILTELMRRQFREIRERGEPIAALHASESAIYGRFGYGLGSLRERWAIERTGTRLGNDDSVTGSVRIIEVEEAMDVLPPVYETARPRRPGMLTRDDRWWHLWFWSGEHGESGGRDRLFAIHGDGPEVDGYVVYTVIPNWSQGVPRGVLNVIELIGATDQAAGNLWRYCFQIDLVESIRAANRPPDDPLPWMLADPRRLQRSQMDGLWIRPVDVSSALSSRRYNHGGKLVLAVADEFCEENSGRYQLEGGEDGASCTTTQEEPDLELSVADLGAVYLGGIRPSILARAGRIQEARPGALKLADDMFLWPVQPWCPVFEPIT